MLLLQSTNFGTEMMFKTPVCNNIKQAELCLPRAFSYWFLSDSGRLAPSVAQFLDLHYKKVEFVFYGFIS